MQRAVSDNGFAGKKQLDVDPLFSATKCLFNCFVTNTWCKIFSFCKMGYRVTFLVKFWKMTFAVENSCIFSRKLRVENEKNIAGHLLFSTLHFLSWQFKNELVILIIFDVRIFGHNQVLFWETFLCRPIFFYSPQ